MGTKLENKKRFSKYSRSQVVKVALFHDELQGAAGHELLVGDLVVLNWLAVEFHALDMDALGGLVFGGDDEILAACEMQRGLGKERRSDDILG